MPPTARPFSAGLVRTVDTSRTRIIAVTLCIVAIAIAARAYGIGSQSLWTDELFSRFYPDLFSLRYLWTTGLLHESSPPLYYMAIEGWMRLFGTSAVAMRSFSLIASVLTLPLIYLIAIELFDRRRGLAAMLLFALLPLQISFAQDARTYTLLLIPLCAALLAVARFLRGDIRWPTLGLYGIGAIIALYCHATAAFFIAACNIVVLIAIVGERRDQWRSALIRWLVINFLIFVLALPELDAMIVQGVSDNGLDWIPPFRPVDIVRALSPVVVGNSTPDKFPGAELSLLVSVGLAAAWLVLRPTRRSSAVLIAIPCVFVVLIALASQLNSIFIARVFSWLDVPLALLLADAILQPWFLRTALACVTGIAITVGLGYQYLKSYNEPWRSLFDQISPRLVHADYVVLAPMTDPTAPGYYAPQLTGIQMLNTGPQVNVENGALPERLHVHWIAPAQFVNEVQSGANVWLIMRPPDMPYVGSLLAKLPAPALRFDRSCGADVCITAFSWSPRSATAGTGASAK